jgi:Peptidase family M48
MSRKLMALGCAIALWSSYSVPAWAHDGEKKTKEEKLEEKEKANEEKNAASYEKIKEFSINKYKTDPVFRDRVDAAFEDKLREHSAEAFEKNVNRKSELVAVAEDTWRRHDYLYDNLMVQDYINRIGQSLVPADSEKLFAFRVVPDATPMARTLSTGTIYVSTGLISLLDSQAQLAFVLAHEMAHVQLDHWKDKVMMEEGVAEYNSGQEVKAGKMALIGGLAGAALGGAIGRSGSSAALGGVAGAGAGFIAGMIVNRPITHTEWDKTQEDQADEKAFQTVLNARYDVREVPRVYMALDSAAARDTRIQLGFIGQRRRLKFRREKAEDLINNSMKAEIALKAKNGFLSSSAEHRNLMAELKRDNGILAYYHDMFELARTNLADAVAIRDNDPAAQYFYGKTLKLVGRTDEDMRLAKEAFAKAVKYDTRNQNYGAHLHLALMMARENGVDPKQIETELDTYVTDYAHWKAERHALAYYPPNLPAIYEYIALYGGDANWKPKLPDLKELIEYQKLAMYGPPSGPVGEAGSDLPPAPESTPAESRRARTPAAKPVRTSTPVKQ